MTLLIIECLRAFELKFYLLEIHYNEELKSSSRLLAAERPVVTCHSRKCSAETNPVNDGSVRVSVSSRTGSAVIFMS